MRTRTQRRRQGWIGALALGLPVALACDGGNAAPPVRPGLAARCRGCNVLLISIDTLRADHLGAYGYERATSPHIDALAEDGILFERAFTQSHNTKISHATLLTSLHPTVHGVTKDTALPERIETLAERLRAGGYTTAGFVTNPGWLGEQSGLAQGFDHYHEMWGNAEKQSDLALAWLADAVDEPFFLFLHYYDVHSDWKVLPYETGTDHDHRFAPPREDFHPCDADVCASRFLQQVNAGKAVLTEEDVRQTVALYDGGISYTDHHVGRVLAELEASGLSANTVVVVTSDHGEEFLEHGKFLHNQLHREVARVPLIIRVPGASTGVRVAQPVGLVDVMPTLLDLVGIEADDVDEVEGSPLLGPGPAATEVVLSFGAGEGDPDIFARGPRFSLRVRHGFSQWELYDTDVDPNEHVDISADRPDDARELLERTRHALQRQQELRDRLNLSAVPAALLEEQEERLKALGYLAPDDPPGQAVP